MNKQRLDEIKARAEAATPQPWFSEDDDETWQLFAGRKVQSHPFQLAKCPKKATQFMEYWPKPEDSDFITHARRDIPDLLAYVEELKNACCYCCRDGCLEYGCECGTVPGDDDDE